MTETFYNWQKEFWNKLNKQMQENIEKQMEFTEQQAQKALESAMKNAEKYLNQDNPTLAMYEFGLARFYKNLLRR